MPKPRVIVILTVLVAMVASLALATPQFSKAAADPQDVAAAEKAAKAWLLHMDAGRYDETWAQAAPMFKQAVPKAKWAQMAQAARGPLGPIAERKIVSATYTDHLPGAPDGEYVVIQTKARFAHKKQAMETITPMKTADGTWRVSGYYIR